MACEQPQKELNDAIQSVTKQIADEMAIITSRAESKSADISSDFERDNQNAANVGAAIGAAAGTVIGGAAGTVVGTAAGKAIGSLFVIEIGSDTQMIALDLPSVKLEDKNISFDLPEVTVKDKDIIFHTPAVKMVTKRGPDVPVTTTWTEQECIKVFGKKICTGIPKFKTEMKPTYFDVPEPYMQENRIVFGVPQVTMRRQDIVLGIPAFTMKRQEFKFDVPRITLRFVKDAGKKAATAASELMSETESSIEKVMVGARETAKKTLIGPNTRLFDCYRSEIKKGAAMVAAQFDPAIASLSGSLDALIQSGVPGDDDDAIALRSQRDAMIQKRGEAVAIFDKALADINAMQAEAIDKLVNQLGEHESVPA